MRTPVDFAREVGEDRDHAQCIMIGRSCVIMGAAMLSLLLVCRDGFARGCVLGLCGFVIAIGAMLLIAARRLAREKSVS
jgi:hypothetical protein